MSPRVLLPLLAAGLLAGLWAGQAWAQPEGLHNVEVIESSELKDPAAIKDAAGADADWMAFRIPVIDGTRAPCCWRNGWKPSGAEWGCSLDAQQGSHGTTEDSPEVGHLVIYAGLRGEAAGRMRLVGSQCPMDGAGKRLAWLDDVDGGATLNWLADIAAGHSDYDAGMALYALAKHGDPEAAKWLESQARNGRGRQREEAMFWLAMERPALAEPLLLDIVQSEGDRQVLEHAIFAISQLPPPRGDELLLEIAQDHERPKAARKQAFFWLANSDDEQTLAALTELLTR